MTSAGEQELSPGLATETAAENLRRTPCASAEPIPGGLGLQELRSSVLTLLEGVADGDRLDALTAAFAAYAVRVSVTCLDVAAAATVAGEAAELGATVDQLHDVILLVSALGVHSLMEATPALLGAAHGTPGTIDRSSDAADSEREALWDRWVGDRPYWRIFEGAVPGFLRSLLTMSPEGFESFMQYGRLPVRSGHLDALTRELVSIAVDSSPSHRYLPGARLHVLIALRLGAGRQAILDVMDIAAAAPPHRGVR